MASSLRSKTVYREVEVSIDLSEVLAEASEEELREELRSRDKLAVSPAGLLEIYEEFYRRGDAPQCLRDFLYEKLGRILP